MLRWLTAAVVRSIFPRAPQAVFDAYIAKRDALTKARIRYLAQLVTDHQRGCFGSLHFEWRQQDRICSSDFGLRIEMQYPSLEHGLNRRDNVKWTKRGWHLSNSEFGDGRYMDLKSINLTAA